MTSIYQLKVTLCDIEPEIWRRIVHGTQPGRARAASKKRPPRTSGSR
ncbi:MAG TPA: hypothetical protein VHT91_43890 [Kofleriaceae bacterium]|nr:hypothetical protein [Kofleriaceae bacterium]